VHAAWWVNDLLEERTRAADACDAEPAADIDLDALPPRLQYLLGEKPVAGTRSDRIYHFVCIGLEDGLADETILAALTHFPPAVDKGNVVRHGQRAIGHARANGMAPDTGDRDRRAENATQPPGNPDVGDIDTAQLLDDTYTFIRRFVVTSQAGLVASALFVGHTHAFAAAESTPRLSVRSAESESGKTRLCESMEYVVREPLLVADISPAGLYRSVERYQPTVLHDEVDTVFKAKSGDDAEVRRLLNAGYRRTGKVVRIVGEGSKMREQTFKVFAPTVLAGIGKLPHTLETRSIVVRMKPRTKGEHVDRMRDRKVRPVGNKLRERWKAWAEREIPGLADAEPDLPDELSDRAQDVWEPLLAIADLAGEEWGKRARAAAVELFKAANGGDEESVGRRLLRDIRSVFDDPERDDPDDDEKGHAIKSGDLASALAAIEGSPWAEWGRDDKPITATTVARKLKSFDIKPDQHKVAGVNVRGYLRSDFEDAWERHLHDDGGPPDGDDGGGGTGEDGSPPPPPHQSVTDAKLLPPNANKGKDGNTSRPVTLSPGGEGGEQ
jgi:hypothetical protein